MARRARVVVAGLPHHGTQRGNPREPIFLEDGDQDIYRDLLAEQARKAGVEVWAYCLTPNHVHLIPSPTRAESLRLIFGKNPSTISNCLNFRFPLKFSDLLTRECYASKLLKEWHTIPGGKFFWQWARRSR